MCSKKVVRPVKRRDLVKRLQGSYDVSERRACRATGFDRASHRYRSKCDPQTELRIRIKDLAAARVRYGYKRICLLLNREGWGVNHKRVYRLYREEGLGIRAKTPRRRRTARYREGRSEIEAINDVWAMDFVSDRLFDQRSFRILALMDCFSRESLAIEPRGRFQAINVIEVLDKAIAKRAPQNQSELTMGRNLPVNCLISRRITMALSSTSLDPENPLITPISSRSTSASEPNA